MESAKVIRLFCLPRRRRYVKALAVTLLGVSLISASRPVRAESLIAGEAAGGKTDQSSLLVITSTSFADDFMAPMRAGPDAWRALIMEAAAANDLPPEFLMRLIAQESGYDPSRVSKAGALGIAQFMPGTATLVGLRDPFDPLEAIPAAAHHLRDLRSHFGNLGLAAAAYNAGAGRVSAWLAGQVDLPLETINYVRSVTGRDASEWVPAAGLAASAALSFRPPRLPSASAARKRKIASTTSLCEAINSAASPCIVQQHY